VSEKDAILRIGDIVMWKGDFGTASAQPARVVGIDISYHGDKYGESVEEIEWENALYNRAVILTLENGRWCYGDQIARPEPPSS
jgi:hypothetical protein